MYVFFDKKGDIKAITPNPDSMFDNYTSANFPLSEVEDFLNGTKNSFNYSVKQTSQLGSGYKIIKKVSNVLVTRTLNSYITKVETPTRSAPPILLITTDLVNSVISLDLHPDFEEVRDDEDDDTEYIFSGTTPINLYLTKKNNPYHLLHTVPFTPKDLLGNLHLDFQYDSRIDLSSSSVYTKKLIDSYGYKIKGKRYVI